MIGKFLNQFYDYKKWATYLHFPLARSHSVQFRIIKTAISPLNYLTVCISTSKPTLSAEGIPTYGEVTED